MANAQTFGRRASAAPSRSRAQPVATGHVHEPVMADAPVAMTSPPPTADSPTVSVEDELRQWKAGRSYKIPWRQLSFMASLCFGIASFELPDSVNDEVNWLLYGLMAISFYVGVSGRFKKKTDAAATRTARDSHP
ncbi:MAG: hypothetical protein ACTHLR_04245 [Rhizomicrobium sp.]